MYQAANGNTPGSRSILPIEPDFHYSVVNVTGSNVVSVDANGKLTAKTALKQCKYASRTWAKGK